ncbi:CU044_2847 family protein [Streptomyces sp. CSDS2]|uniref:CU044_2847 family protein n=1 Tax=Streptomyces sp. CSDS2 TaxID=3055051 RepID=UPI0025B06272|nr:CU044_2847 family protein [Streptomyces sp. CSDS2]MDN3260438.1 CU044_2847 family protein [Streptomyces sp. CSDS2]
MRSLARISLEGGGAILFEASEASEVPDGPVKAGRLTEAIHDLPANLRSAMAPVREAAQTVLDELREAGPDEVEVEFGLNLAASAGAVITKGEMAGHLRVRLLWQRAADRQSAP